MHINNFRSDGQFKLSIQNQRVESQNREPGPYVKVGMTGVERETQDTIELDRRKKCLKLSITQLAKNIRQCQKDRGPDMDDWSGKKKDGFV